MSLTTDLLPGDEIVTGSAINATLLELYLDVGTNRN